MRPTSICTTCNRLKAPRGRDVPAGMGSAYCAQGGCPGYEAQPLPDTLWPDERRAAEAAKPGAPRKLFFVTVTRTASGFVLAASEEAAASFDDDIFDDGDAGVDVDVREVTALDGRMRRKACAGELCYGTEDLTVVDAWEVAQSEARVAAARAAFEAAQLPLIPESKP